MSEIRWQVVDPLGNKIYLTEENFRYHIIGMHDSKDAETCESLEDQVKYSIQHPRSIVKHEGIEGRRVYLDLTDVTTKNSLNIRPLFVVVEENGEIVTWFAKRTVNVNVHEDGGVIYDRRISYLQIQSES